MSLYIGPVKHAESTYGLLEKYELYHVHIEGKSLLLASFKCWGWVFTCPNMVAVAFISQVKDTSSLSSIVLEDQGSTTQIWSNHYWTPVARIVHWAQCQNILHMTFFQLLVVCDLLNDSMWCMHGVSGLACPSSGCVTASSNLRQQHPFPFPAPFTTTSYSTNHSLLATDLWKQMFCGAEIANHENALDVTAELPCHFHLPQ
jgi:hypothetical protein